ncbi:dipeptidase PepV [Leuconostoc gelidum subsp. gelidum]|uniref:Dipeptidase PepV n=1 Tax=Leuconostoc gelidum subsp. gelidum TaxID=1607839 RepID=A0AB35G0P2_LEUGE|nr:dipeptidase PepV [Leuconostoc gelidum]MBZ5964756.1 dipeptidase PepV [Leuconostoc gelidum subsp. gelidum]MBZ5974639.1 dipeptidase PepV [Leuconostoc gelidum subsp. gelidum]MBZ5977479.1 dipeptidase PepV [Leuconostoc gelidum subsp. gelidum]MBZ5986583.1 dipeptidase PepV [Leuconostoc gelidum subsp. gelidum]MBZ5999190.1 dipeptidase PepV [Leuconostoc gelidum subsp. gelidum]
MQKTAREWQEEAKKYQPSLQQDLLQFLAIPSVLDTTTATFQQPFGIGIETALQFLFDLATRDGFIVTRVADNMVVVVDYGPNDAAETVGVLSHVDVVPGNASAWRMTLPFSPKIVGNRLYGRGTHDMKADLIASYYALLQLKNNGFLPKRGIRLIFGSDEESDWRDMKAYLAQVGEPTLGFSPDGAFPVVPGEKGVQTITIKFKGETRVDSDWQLLKFDAGERDNVVPGVAKAIVSLPDNFDINQFLAIYEQYLTQTPLITGIGQYDDGHILLTLYGKAVHGAYPEDGLNAGTYLAHFLNQFAFEGQAHAFLEFLGDDNHQNVFGEKVGLVFHDAIMGDLTMNIGKMTYRQAQPSQIRIQFRFPIGITETAILTQVQRHIGDLNAKIFKETQFGNQPHMVNLDDPIVQTLESVYAQHTNTAKTYKISNGGSYARLLKRGVAFGGQFPNVEVMSHQPDEYVLLENIPKAQAIFAQALYELAK